MQGMSRRLRKERLRHKLQGSGFLGGHVLLYGEVVAADFLLLPHYLRITAGSFFQFPVAC